MGWIAVGPVLEALRVLKTKLVWSFMCTEWILYQVRRRPFEWWILGTSYVGNTISLVQSCHVYQSPYPDYVFCVELESTL